MGCYLCHPELEMVGHDLPVAAFGSGFGSGSGFESGFESWNFVD